MKRTARKRNFRCTFRYEQRLWDQGYRLIAGVDEVGRGALCGPVVAAAVIFSDRPRVRGIDDSKKLTPEKRERLKPRILTEALCCGVGIVSAEEIDRINIYQATLKAMRIAISQLTPAPDFVLYDGNRVKGMTIPNQNLVKGDARSKSIAAASILAKVIRDSLMQSYAALYPVFDWESNKGYSCPKHFAGLRAHGPCPLHRRSFEPVRLANQLDLFPVDPETADEEILYS